VIALRQLLKHLGRDGQPISYAVQGFGNVGSFFATVAAQDHPNWKLVAASDSGSAVYCREGLDAKELDEYKQSGGRFADFKKDGVEVISNDDLLALDVDVLALAALGDSVNENNYKTIKTSIILELGNGPVGEKAFDKLSARAVTIVPDIVANAGGVIVSYLEWVQNKADEHWSEDEVNQKLEDYMVKASDELYQTADKQKVTLKEAAFINAIKRMS
jgi:glutamate dehydrogenase/leucine dehydrogenase